MTQNLVGSRYELLELIGQGGMGRVYRALDRLTSTIVAFKRMRLTAESPLAMTNLDVTNRDTQPRIVLAREFQTLASLHHPYIISVLDYGFDEAGRPYLTMPLLEKTSSISEVAKDAPREQQLRYIIQILQALAYLHRHNIIHRDIKPGNILIDQQTDEVRIVDFGLASAGGISETLDGTPAYIAPEIFNGQEASRASDLYAVGLIIYEIFTGRFPYRTQNFHVLIDDITRLHPPLEDVPPEFVYLVSRLVEKNLAYRYSDAEVVIAELCSAAGISLPEENVAIRESFLQSAVFVGRENELSQLRAALDNIIGGSGTGWLVGGESGVGKSRLLHELRTYAMVKGVQVLRASAQENEGLTVSFWRDLMRQFVLAFTLDETESSILADFVPDLEAIEGRSIQRAPRMAILDMQQRALLTMIGVMLRHNRPTLLVLEDLHWTDDLSPLEQFSPFLDTMPLMIVGTYRNDERPDVPLRLPHMHNITLERLSHEDMVALSVFMLGEAGRDPDLLSLLQRETEGNVFFLIEVLRALAQDAGYLDAIGRKRLPQSIFTEGIRSIVRRRLSRLSLDYHPMLRVAAVYGRQIDLKLLQCIDDELDYDDWLIHCANVALLEKDSRNIWQFAHDKLRDGILLEVAEREVAKLHLLIAEAIEEAYPNDVSFSPNLATHWRMSGDMDRERPYALQATEYLASTGRVTAAIQMGERALSIVDYTDVSTLAALRVQLGALYQQLGNLQNAAEYLLIGLRDAEMVQNDPLQERALRLLGQTEITRGNWPLGAQLLERSYALSQTLGDSLHMADNMVLLATVAGWRHDLKRQKALYQEAYTIYETHESSLGLSDCLWGLAMIAMVQGDLVQASDHLDEAVRTVRAAGQASRLPKILVTASLVAYLRGDHRHSRAFAFEAMHLSDRLGLVTTRIDSRICLARIHMMEGRFSEASGALRLALKNASDYGHQARLVTIVVEFARLRFYQGQNTAAAEMVNAALVHPRLLSDTRQLIAEPLRDQIRGQMNAEDWALAERFSKGWGIKEVVSLIAAEIGVAV